MATNLNITVNGKTWPVASSPDTPLLYVLTNELHLHGPRFGCGLAQCGSCSVLADDKEIRSCITPVATVADRAITTLEGLPAWYARKEGLKETPALHPLQQAFIDEDAIGCGYCTPGWLMAGKDLLDRKRNPSDDDIDQLPNLCRCGCQTRVRRAIKRAAGVIGGNK